MVMTNKVIFQKTLGIISTVFVHYLHQTRMCSESIPIATYVVFVHFVRFINFFEVNIRWSYTIAASNIFLVRLLTWGGIAAHVESV